VILLVTISFIISMILAICNIRENTKPTQKQLLLVGFNIVMILFYDVMLERSPVYIPPNVSLTYQGHRFNCTNTISMRQIDFKRFIHEGGQVIRTGSPTTAQ
jgi:hypothetical protein